LTSLRLNRVEKSVLRALQKESSRIAKIEGVKKPSVTIGVFYRRWNGLFDPPDTIILNVNMFKRFSKTGLLSDFIRIFRAFYHEIAHVVQYQRDEDEADKYDYQWDEDGAYKYATRMVAERTDFLLSTHGRLLSMISSRLDGKERERLERRILKEILDVMLSNTQYR